MNWLKRHARTVAIAALAAILALSLTMVAVQQAQYRENAAVNAEAEELTGLPLVRARLEAEAAAAASVPDSVLLDSVPPKNIPPLDAAVLLELDLAALQAVNPDVVGWIEISGTEVSYPVVQGGDNQYYLKHNWKQESNRGGSIFLEATSSVDFSDFHTIIYGHRMRDGSMFGSIQQYKEQSYWQEHPDIYIAAEGRVYRYTIFSAHESGVRDLTYRLDLVESSLQEEFLRYCADESVIETGGLLDNGHILTLSTCAESGYRTRWVVHGYLAGMWES